MRRHLQLGHAAHANLVSTPRSTEYIALVGSFLLVGLEALVRVFTLALREDSPALCRVDRRPMSNIA